MKLKELVNYLNKELTISDFEGIDISLNGLQVGDESRQVKKIAFAVDACQTTINAAVKQHYDLLIVHHGLFWGKPLAITGPHLNRVKTLIENNLSLYACHLPLDASPLYGNNIEMAKLLKLDHIKGFGQYHSKNIGYSGILPTALTPEELIEKLGVDKKNVKLLSFGKKTIKSVAIISGSDPYEVSVALTEGLDAYITGVGIHEIFHTAEEGKINMVCLGHYASETFGVKALKALLEQQDFDTVFIDVPTNL